VRVTKRAIQEGVVNINDIQLLADFLNFDFSSGSQRRLKKGLKKFLNTYGLNKLKGEENRGNLKEEIIYYLKPIVAPWSIDTMVTTPSEAVRSYLQLLVDKINHLDLKPQWVIEWGDYGLYQSIGGKEYFPPGQIEWVDPPPQKVHNPAYRYLWAGQKVLKTPDGEKYIVRKHSFQPSSPEQHLYGIIIEILENGELKRLKRCPECQKFFVAEDLKQTYCTPKCKLTRDERDAPNRMRRYRKNKQKKEMRGE